MQKKLWIVIALLLVVPLMFLTTSCQQQVVKTDPGAGEGAGSDADTKPETAEERAARIAREKFVNEDVYFIFDSSSLSAEAQGVLREKADWLKQNPNQAIAIEGHCDERGTNEYNLALGERRAESAKAFLLDLGIEASRLPTTSYGEERPIDTGHDEGAWAKNRRAHFVLR